MNAGAEAGTVAGMEAQSAPHASFYRRNVALCRGVSSMTGGLIAWEILARYDTSALFVAVVILAGVGVLSVIGLRKRERWLAPWRDFAVRT